MQQTSSPEPGRFQLPRPWRSHPRETLGTAMLGAIALVALGNDSLATPLLPEFATQAETGAALPRALPSEIRALAPDTALEVNAGIPLAEGPNPAAAAFRYSAASAETRARALECLTSAVYYEAAQEPTNGQRAVAQVVLNRVRHPAFPNSVCGVVFEGSNRASGCQFTFTCDGSMRAAPLPSLWERARAVAAAALGGYVYGPAGHATHYHANYVVPYWASSLTKNLVEGAHIFYRWPGGWGKPAAFTARWAGLEADPGQLRLAALSTPRAIASTKNADATVEKLEQAGARVVEGKNGRVRLLFTPEAREVVEKVKVTPYVERVAATDNLRFALNGGSAADSQRPFGKASTPPAAAPAPSQTASAAPQ